jgi:hypothetical protein
MEAGKASVTGISLFDENARVAGTEEVDEPVLGDQVGAEIGGALDGLRLAFADAGNERVDRVQIGIQRAHSSPPV